ncbi:MAG TPA: response regulator transcription factor [Saprospiraceae bacterium]|nr:response regulator transcription factor [Saprospiraceae bacterium]HMU05768.1 response regulator transcription factor [Saprospiraceae bacterium]
MPIAIIEDDANIRSLIKVVLSPLNTPIDEYENGWKGLDALSQIKYDLLVLDLMLPGVNGLEICRKVRQANNQMPILMLTAKSEEDDKISGLDMGADDYLTKPFSNGELLARVKALLRRSENKNNSNTRENLIITIGELVLDVSNRTLTKNNSEISLSAKEYDLILLFMSNPGRNFSRIEVLERVWGEHFEGLEHTVNSNINRLRSKIEDDSANPKYLVTVWGLGYKFNKSIDTKI